MGWRNAARPLAVLAAAASLVAVGGHVRAAPEEYEIDPEHFSIGFMASHLGFQNQLGMFLKGEGSFLYDPEVQEVTDIRIEVEAKSVFTNNKRRDKHLRSPDFLNAKEFPKIIFTGTSAEKISDTTGRIHGELELLGQTRPITLEVRLNQIAVYAFGHKRKTIGISAHTSFRRSAFGMTYGVDDLVGDEIQMFFEFEALKQ
ncbi:MAG: YceI family protein [Alphaproteobacteria bacterium]